MDLAVKHLARGAIILHADEPALVIGACGPIPCTFSRWEIRLKRLGGAQAELINRSGWRDVEVIELPERELLYLYRADVGHVLYDPAAAKEFIVARCLDDSALSTAEPGVPLLAGFWGDQPVWFRAVTPDGEAEGEMT